MYYMAGESNVPGAGGNLGGARDLVYRNEPVKAVPMPYYGGGMGVETLAGGNFMGGQGSAINQEAFKKDARQQKIYNKGMGTDNPNEREIFLRRTGPQLPMAGIGNVGGMLAQSYPMYGDTINMGPMEGDYSNMPIMGIDQDMETQRQMMLEDYRNRAFPQNQMPAGFYGKYIT